MASICDIATVNFYSLCQNMHSEPSPFLLEYIKKPNKKILNFYIPLTNLPHSHLKLIIYSVFCVNVSLFFLTFWACVFTFFVWEFPHLIDKILIFFNLFLGYQ